MTGSECFARGSLLEQAGQDNRIRIRQPQHNLQKKIVRALPNGHEFVAYIDAIGELDGQQRCWNGRPRAPAFRTNRRG